MAQLNHVMRTEPALHELDFTPEGFEWIEASDGDHNVISFLRKSKDGKNVIAVVCNFAGIPHNDFRIGLPKGGSWKEILNTDDLAYGGSGVGNFGDITTERVPWNGRPFSADLQLPPFGVIYLAPVAGGTDEPEAAVTEAAVSEADVASVEVKPAPVAESATSPSADSASADSAPTAD